MIRLALRNLLARKRRTVLTALAVVVGVAQVTGAFILTDSMNSTIDDLFKTGQRGVDVVVTPKESSRARRRPACPLHWNVASLASTACASPAVRSSPSSTS